MEMTNTTAGATLENLLAAVRVRRAILLSTSDAPDDDEGFLPDGTPIVSLRAWTYTWDQFITQGGPPPIDHREGGTELMLSAPQAVMLASMLLSEAYAIDPTIPRLDKVMDELVVPLLRMLSVLKVENMDGIFGLLAPNWHDVAFNDDVEIERP